MTATISLVGATPPEGLLNAANQQTASVASLNSQIDAQQGALTQLGGGWEGSAATAAKARAEQDLARQRQMVGRLEAMSVALRSGGTNLAALRTQILSVSTQAAALGGMVSDDGTVRPMGDNLLMTPALAGAYTSTLKALLTQFDAVDASTAQALSTGLGPAPEQPPPPDFEWTEEDLYDGDPSGADINQDEIGDCYLMATMGAIAHADPQRIKDRISYNPQTGEFDVTLWDGKAWRHIPVTQADIDANIAAKGGSGVDNYPSGGKPLWPAVLESAYAKMHGKDLKGIESGLAPSAMEALTGNDGKWVIPATEWFTTQHIDTQITEALKSHQPVTVSTSLFGGTLEDRHVYAVEGIAGRGSDAVVTMRNPWGDGAPIQMRLGDLVGTNPLGGLGLGPTAMINIGQM
jgi:Calpain family cysteine protease